MKKHIQLKNQTYKKYKKIKPAVCPYLKQKVVFNSKGFWHMIYKARNKKRDLRSQKLRFYLLETAVKLIRLTTTLQEYEEVKRRRIEYYGFIAIINGWKIKVIVKKVGRGRPFFWSVIPNWVTRKRADKKIKILFKGDMERD